MCSSAAAHSHVFPSLIRPFAHSLLLSSSSFPPVPLVAITADRIRNTEDKTQKLTSSRLVIRGTERSDGGVYQCNATNKWGHDYSLIQLIVKGSSVEFIGSHVHNKSTTCDCCLFPLTCTSPSSGLDPLSFVLHGYKKDPALRSFLSLHPLSSSTPLTLICPTLLSPIVHCKHEH